jgi:ribosomal protein L37AE/L43A
MSTERDVHEIVPDDFELRNAKYSWSSTPDDEHEHCPECHARSITRRLRSATAYRCDKCGACFDEPIPHSQATEWFSGDRE